MRRVLGVVAMALVVLVMLALGGTAAGALTLHPPGPVVIVGDSVTAIANEAPGQLLARWKVDAVRGRTMERRARSDEGLDAIKRLRAAGVHGRWVIALGVNDLYYQTANVTTLTWRVRHLVAATGSSDVTWVIPYVWGGYSPERAALHAEVPALLAAVKAAGVTHVIRWDLAGRPSDTYDGLHPTAAGARHYAAVVIAGEGR